jgi:hypothetical protein
MRSRKRNAHAAIIPLGHGSRRDSSSLPEGCSLQWLAPPQRERIRCSDRREAATARTLTRRAGPALPSYLALHHAGFSVPRVLPHERWALTPPFHPCQTKRAVRRRLAGFPARCHRAASAGGTFSVALSVSESADTGRSLCHPNRPPGVTRRVALYPEPAKAGEGFYPDDSGRCPDFPPVRPSCDGQTSDHPARPPSQL